MSQQAHTKRSLYHGWLPPAKIRHAFIAQKLHTTNKSRSLVSKFDAFGLISEKETPKRRTAAVTTFANAIRGNVTMRDLLEQIFPQVEADVARWGDPNHAVKSISEFLDLLDIVVQEPPGYYIAKRDNGDVIREPIGMPMYLVFDMLSNTSAAYDLLRLPEFNAALKALLDSWGEFLTTRDSIRTLNGGQGGWFSKEGMETLTTCLGKYSFDETYVCPDPSAENKGFQSWDAFFTRHVRPQARPVEALFEKDADVYYPIHNACESTTLRWSDKVQLHDKFWLKEQRYSLYDMLGRNAEDAKKFVGGSVYQAFLSPQDYHRWHSPISGTITKTVILPGTYYAVLPDEGEPNRSDDSEPNGKPTAGVEQGDTHGALIRSQAWLTVAATRALIFIEADNPKIGLACFIGVGMAEVSTCHVTVNLGQHVNAGDQLGMFHFGGSSHTLIFGPHVKISFETSDGTKIAANTHHWVKTIIGKVRIKEPEPER